MNRLFGASLAVLVLPACHTAGPADKLAPNAPSDRTIVSKTTSDLEAQHAELEPCVTTARATWRQVKQRYLAGLPQGHVLSVTVRLHDARGKEEQAFLVVDRLRGTRIEGRIANEIQLVEGFKYGQHHEVDELDIIDWTISLPDGSEEGNLVGKHLETGTPCPTPPGS